MSLSDRGTCLKHRKGKEASKPVDKKIKKRSWLQCCQAGSVFLDLLDGTPFWGWGNGKPKGQSIQTEVLDLCHFLGLDHFSGKQSVAGLCDLVWSRPLRR